jgi:hypothetical protein
VANKKEEDLVNGRAPQRPALWLQLAQEEIGFRLEADETEHDASLDRELEMQLRLRARYSDIPIGLALRFTNRIRHGSFTWESWDDAVAWLEQTKWFRQRRDLRR